MRYFVLSLLDAVACYLLYGTGRTVVEAFGFSLKGFWAGLFLCALFAGPFFLALTASMWGRGMVWTLPRVRVYVIYARLQQGGVVDCHDAMRE